MGSCCSALVPKYAQHVDALLPAATSASEVATLGGVLDQDDVSQWKMRVSPNDMTAYARGMPEQLAPMALYIQKKIRNELNRGRLRFAAIAMQALIALVDACHADETLALYESSVVNSMLLCFSHENKELQILAAQCLCTMLRVQAQQDETISTSRIGQVYSSTDYAKFALFYPYILRMATRNPSTSVLARVGAQAKELFNREHENSSDGDATHSHPPRSTKEKRVKDLAELDRDTSTHANGGSGGSSSSSSDSSEDRLKQRISLWRSRYFGLKALKYMLQFNRDTSASLTRLRELIPTLLINLPKSKRAIHAVAMDWNIQAMNKVDETFKVYHASSHGDEKKAKEGQTPQPAPGQSQQADASGATPKKDKPASSDQLSLPGTGSAEKKRNNESAKRNHALSDADISLRTGITLHHVQLLAYDCFISLCKLPGLNLHFMSFLNEMFAWLDVNQPILQKTAFNGTKEDGKDASQAQLAHQPSSAVLTSSPHAASSSSSGSPDPIVGWCDLHFTSHVFLHLICSHASSSLFEGGSIDLLVLALMHHVDEIDMASMNSASGVSSRRNSKNEEGLGLVVESPQEEKQPTSSRGSTLKQDFKQLFNTKKRGGGGSRVPVSALQKNIKTAQIAIVHLLGYLLSHVNDERHTVDGSRQQSLCIMNYQILIDTYLSHLVSAVRSNELRRKARAQHASGGGGSVAPASATPHTADQHQYDFEQSMEASIVLDETFIQLLTHLMPTRLVQCFYSQNDILQSITMVINRAIYWNQQKLFKRALMDAAYSMILGLLKRGGDVRDDADAPLGDFSSSALYDALTRSALGTIACETDPALRAVGYKLMQALIMCETGFGGSWQGPPTHLPTFGSSFGSGLNLHGLARGNSEVDANINGTGSSVMARNATGKSAGLTLELPNDDKMTEKSEGGNESRSELPQAEPSPSPTHSLSLPSHHSNEKQDLRGRKIPQIFASSLDVASQLNSVTNASAARGYVNSTRIKHLSAQDQKWLLSIIYYEITASFAAPSPENTSASSLDAPPSSAPQKNDSNAFQVASTIIKQRGRGATTNENVILCFQLLLLMLQRLPITSSSSNDDVTMQSTLSFQLPFICALLSYVRSCVGEDKFYLPLLSQLRLHTFIHTYLAFLSKLLSTASMDSHWLRQQSASLEEFLLTLAVERSKKQEGGGELEASWLQGLVQVKDGSIHNATQITTQIDEDALSSILARLLVERPDGTTTSAMDESLDSLINSHKANLMSGVGFEPFSLQFLLPESTLVATGGAFDPEMSQSWAPSGRLAIATSMESEETRIGGAGIGMNEYAMMIDELNSGGTGSNTPRLQYSPGLKSRAATLNQPMSSPSVNNPSNMQLTASSSFGTQLATIAASPQPQLSVADMMAEMDQQSFQTIASNASKTHMKNRSHFEEFMTQIEPATTVAAQTNGNGNISNGKPKSTSSADEQKLKPTTLREEKLVDTKSSPSDKKTMNGHAESDRKVALERANSRTTPAAIQQQPDFHVMKPATRSTLELNFPQLSSFDLYLHSEFE